MLQIHWATILTSAAAVLAVVIASAALVVSIRANRHAAVSAEAARKSADAADEANRLETARRLDEMAPQLSATAEWSDPRHHIGTLRIAERGMPDRLSATVHNESNREYKVTSVKAKPEGGGSYNHDQSDEDVRTLSGSGSLDFVMGEYFHPGGNTLDRPEPQLYTRLNLILETPDGIGKWQRCFDIPLYERLLNESGYIVNGPVPLTAVPCENP